MIPRHLTPALRRAARTNPVVTLTGPRQSGKTTLVRSVFPDHLYLSLEAPDVRERALADPRGLLAASDYLILDEIQRVPELLSYLQGLVDEDERPGRFIVTGSQNLLLMETVSQTLAGRTAILRLFPFSIAELQGRSPLDPLMLDRPEAFPHEVSAPPFHPSGLWDTLATGFYPRVHDRNEPAFEWLGDYVRTYVERDLREVLQVTDLRAFENFLRLAAARTASELNLNGLASDTGISQQTARRWLSALEIGHLATTLPPHSRNFRKRLRKRPRLHFLDSGLVCYLLGIRDGATLEHHPLRGAIFESFVVGRTCQGVRRDAAGPATVFLARRHGSRNRHPDRCWRAIDSGRGEVGPHREAGRHRPSRLVDGAPRKSESRGSAGPRRRRRLHAEGFSSCAVVSERWEPTG